METIQPNARVVLDYTLKGEDGQILDESRADGGEPIVYVHGYGMIVPGLEVALAGMKAGEVKTVRLTPEEGFGEIDDELVFEVDREDFPRPAEVAPGDELVAESATGEEVVMRVLEVFDESVRVDANHPLAGKTLHYEVLVREVGAASELEIAEAAQAFEEAGYEGGEQPHAHEGGNGQSNGGGPSDLVQLGRRPRS